jgi:hypothetical protein
VVRKSREQATVNCLVWAVRMIAIIDESTPQFHAPGQVLYGIAAVILHEADQDVVRLQLQGCLHRKRPLHWESEGPVVKRRVVELISELPLSAHVCSLVVRHSQQPDARTRLLTERIWPLARGAGTVSYLIEQRSKSEDERDRRDLRNWSRTHHHQFPAVEHVLKSEPLAWVSDALAGIWTDAVLGRGDGSLRTLMASGIVASCQHDPVD